ncbi:flagellar basal body P-ring protein FlgI [Imhoffiella purpurea]|uniref:Flagellar P-ring protein n=1 Tax=Imhoffiella purpurea TaxID=1249627 RepID=W9W2W7_9GAMM|nr:flagellar basal body P-ring protein FlgI [Imhoffiella purpurea]EXJ16910.1 Flagellar P-ring protein FlgI [Imhoffiella purpurea]
MKRIRSLAFVACIACLGWSGVATVHAGNNDPLDEYGLRTGSGGNEDLGLERIKDLANIAGVRTNQLVGYGLVVGLNGTGDQTTQSPFTVQSLKNMLGQLGVTVPSGSNPQTKNVAAVMITADLPAFAKPGQQLDVTVSSLGNAKSLRGGTLLMTPLKGADGQVYAMAQGNLTVGGFGADGADGSRITVNIPSVGRIMDGATVEREVPSGFSSGGSLVLNLKEPDFTTASRMADIINQYYADDIAQPLDATSVEVRAPSDPGQRVSFASQIENLEVAVAEPPARVVINARTGTVVIGSGVKVLPAAVSHGNLTVTIAENAGVSQPQPFGQGRTAVVPQSDINIEQDDNRMFLFAPGTSLGDIVEAVNEVGAAPGDLVAILEALREVGALRADLVVI